jgi:hypothetical protein
MKRIESDFRSVVICDPRHDSKSIEFSFCFKNAPESVESALPPDVRRRFAPPDEVFQSVWAAPFCENHLIPEGRSPKNLKEAI